MRRAPSRFVAVRPLLVAFALLAAPWVLTGCGGGVEDGPITKDDVLKPDESSAPTR